MSCSHDDHPGMYCPDRVVSQYGYLVTRLQRDHGVSFEDSHEITRWYADNVDDHPFARPGSSGRETRRISTWDHLVGVS